MNTPLPTDSLERPQWACQLHRPPSNGVSWVKSDDGYRTCSGCLDRLRDNLLDVAKRFGRLDATPGASGDYGSRGAPGFGSRSPASDTVIVMRDHRSSAEAHVWKAGDGRIHRESERPPLSVYGILETEAFNVAELRDMNPPDERTVPGLARWLDGQLDWLTRQEFVREFADTIHELLAQLRPLTGDARRPIGVCPNVIDEGPATRPCGARLYAPLTGDSIRCGACSRTWHRSEWMRLGDLLDAS